MDRFLIFALTVLIVAAIGLCVALLAGYGKAAERFGGWLALLAAVAAYVGACWYGRAGKKHNGKRKDDN